MHSLRLKLIGWFLLVLFIVIVSFSLLLYFSKQRSLYNSFDSELLAKAVLLSNNLEIEQGKIVLKTESQDFVGAAIP
ncbi:MAG: hypothetical protein N3A72_07190, partial [bacterium]|nr:hypothetical protein [bacterium]